MYSLHYNEETNVYTIIPSGVTITEAHDGRDIMISDNIDYLMGIAHGIDAGKSMVETNNIEMLKESLAETRNVLIKQD